MTKTVRLEILGLTFYVELEVLQDDPLCIEGVLNVYAEMKNGTEVALKCDTERFYKDLEGELYEALENAIADDRIAHYEMVMDARREEGK